MPSVSKKQAVAMRIAAAGKSDIGIPKKAGQEFVKADRHQSGKHPGPKHKRPKT